MLFEFGIFGSLISALLSILMVSFLHNNLSKSQLPKQVKPDENQSDGNDSRRILLKILISILTLLILSKFITVVIFPMEISTGEFKPDTNVFTLILYLGSVLMLFATAFMLFVILYYFRIKDDKKSMFLKKSTSILKYFLIFDIAYSILFMVSTNYYFLLSVTPKNINMFTVFQKWPYRFEVTAILLGIIILYSLLYYRFQKRKSLINFRIYGIFLVMSLLASLYLMLIHSASLVDSVQAFFALFSIRNGFTGLLWIFIFLLGVSSQLFSLLILSIKRMVVHLQLNMNYILQLNRIAFMSTAGIGVLALFPVAMELIYRY